MRVVLANERQVMRQDVIVVIQDHDDLSGGRFAGWFEEDRFREIIGGIEENES